MSIASAVAMMRYDGFIQTEKDEIAFISEYHSHCA
jgi:hypothetical protein